MIEITPYLFLIILSDIIFIKEKFLPGKLTFFNLLLKFTNTRILIIINTIFFDKISVIFATSEFTLN